MKYDVKDRKREKCLECGHPIVYGRIDKKFCSDSCKNRYHNRESSQFLRVHSKVIHTLDKNYRILTHCIDKGIVSIDLRDLIQWGFNPEYVTGVHKARMKTENRCFDIKYLRSDNRIYNIEKVCFNPEDSPQ